MRTDYGKLMYLLQDSQQPEIQALLEFSSVRDIRTVYSFLAEHHAERMLDEPEIELATRAISPDRPDGTSKSRDEIRAEVRGKERAVENLARKYRTKSLSADDIKHCLYSIGDNNSFLLFNRDPIDKMIRYLKHYFDPEHEEENFSLAIYGGQDGARLTHSHERQYHYALQSLTLWRDITHHMYKLWFLADSDLLSPDNPYQLKDTGQGLNRVQQAPLVDKCMRLILHRSQQRVAHWVGSSVIHLGDTNVPNALMFIDKYTQVSRILNPIVLTLEHLDRMYRDEIIRDYLTSTYGTADHLRKTILWDFFRSAFDGSGADNFFDAGSCIDGRYVASSTHWFGGSHLHYSLPTSLARLTSAWNWCSLIDSKPFYPVFKLAGFIGFDGKFV